MATEDISGINEPNFSWKDGERAESLKAVYQSSRGKLDKAIEWYRSNRQPAKSRTWWFRICAVIFGALAAAIPIVAEITRDPNGSVWVRPGMASLCALVAGLMILLDRLVGSSSAWMRYMSAGLTLWELREELDLSFVTEKADWPDFNGSPEPTIDQTRRGLVLLQGFLVRGNKIVRDETNQWVEEFRSALLQAEEFAKTAPRKVDEAIVSIKITNPDRMAGPWSISVDGAPPETRDQSSVSASFRRVPGAVTISVKAKAKKGAGPEVQDFSTDLSGFLTANAVKEFDVTLPP